MTGSLDAASGVESLKQGSHSCATLQSAPSSTRVASFLSRWLRKSIDQNTLLSTKRCTAALYPCTRAPPLGDGGCSIADDGALPRLAVRRMNEDKYEQATCFG